MPVRVGNTPARALPHVMMILMALLQHKKIGLDYEIVDKYEAGIELLGTEVKSVRAKLGKLEGGYVTIRGGEAFLMNTEIPPFQPLNAPKDFDQARIRKLLLSKKELSELANLEAKQGLTIVPVSVYNKGRKLKIEIAVVKGKKKHDKRESLKKKQSVRDVAREYRDR